LCTVISQFVYCSDEDISTGLPGVDGLLRSRSVTLACKWVTGTAWVCFTLRFTVWVAFNTSDFLRDGFPHYTSLMTFFD